MKRLLVTGARGFIGRHCLPLLTDRDFEVHAVSTCHQAASTSRVVWHRVDLHDRPQVVTLMQRLQPTHLLHLAWIATPGDFWNSPTNLTWLEASLALVAAFHECGGRRIVVAGSCAEYDWRYGFCREDVTPLAPATLYGASKHALHITIDSFARNIDLSLAWARLFHVYGPSSPVSKMPTCVLAALAEGRTAQCSNGEQLRDFLHVRDAANALCMLIDSESHGPFNIASGVPTPVKDVILKIADLVGRRDLIDLSRSARTDGTDPPVLVAHTERVRAELGWRPAYDLDRGLADVVSQWHRPATAIGKET